MGSVHGQPANRGFGYADDDRGDGAAKARAYEQSATEARPRPAAAPTGAAAIVRAACGREREENGVWVGVKPPGGQFRKPEQLAGRTTPCAGSSRRDELPAAARQRRPADAARGKRSFR